MASYVPRDDELQSRLAPALGASYELRGLVGRGGFAVVYAAVDAALKRDVAIKVLRPELAADSGMRQRFRREAEAVARLRHPHIVPIYSVGEGEGLVWYVMPLVGGPSLKVYLEQVGRLPIADARRMLSEAATALSVAHHAGIVHRDIKPDNILLDGADARVLLTDFGIAKALAGGSDSQTLTQTGVVIGTPHYMSPEQASGEPTDARSDVYSLGVVAYQLLTGELPFEAATVAALLVKQLVADAPSVLRKRPDCPSDLAAAVTRCLAKEPGQRWGSVDDFQRAIAPAGATVEVRRSGSGPRPVLSSPMRRFRVTAGVALAGIAALFVIDLLRGQVLFGPLGVLVAGFVIAMNYGRLWTAGYTWRDVFARLSTGATRSPLPLDSAEFGPHESAIQQARAERAAMRVQLERVPRSGRQRFETAVSVADALLAKAGALARQLYALERQIEPGPEEIDRRLAATEGEPPSPGRAQRLAVLERRRDAVRGLIARRDGSADALARTLTTLGRLRAAVERGPDEIQQAVSDANTCLETPV
jgi:tRNA A-37 threonylcarbamoyl transferase component Bud32